jgi:sulfur carrier protein ThiS
MSASRPTPQEGAPRTLNVRLQPEERDISLPWLKTVAQLLAHLGLELETAIVARDGQLLTPDRHLWPGDLVLVRKVGSTG